MVNSTVNIQSKQRGDVTPQIIYYHQLYGGSDNTNPSTLVASRSLNYANGSTTQKPTVVPITVVPQRLNYKDTVGLFGVENAVLRFDLMVKDTGADVESGPLEGVYQPAVVKLVDDPTTNTYEPMTYDRNKDLTVVNTYEPVRRTADLPDYWRPLISVALINNGTGNHHVDRWLDITFLDQNKQPMESDAFFTPLKSTFYVSVTARNTKRLPYDFTLVLGAVIVSENDLTPRMRKEANIVS